MYNSKRGSLTILILLLAALPALAKSNFSGEWKINKAKSSFGGLPAPEAYDLKISHEDPKLKVVTNMTTKQGPSNSEASYTTDGQESSNQRLKSTLKWEGDALVIESTGQIGDDPTVITIQDRWTLSPDGKTLSIARRMSSSKGKLSQKLLLVKQ